MDEKPAPNDLSFEELTERLAEVVDRLERGDLSLDQAIDAYEQGVTLVRRCNDLLDRAELRITELSTSVGRSGPSRLSQMEALFSIDTDEDDE